MFGLFGNSNKEKDKDNQRRASGSLIGEAEVSFDLSIPIFNDIDESQVEVTDADLDDPDLLEELKAINSSEQLLSTELKQHNIILTGEVKPPSALSNESGSSDSTVVFETPDEPSEPSGSSHDAKKAAVQFKRDGNVSEALKWMRYAKNLETIESGSQNIPAVPTQRRDRDVVKGIPSVVLNSDRFSDLENAICEAIAANRKSRLKSPQALKEQESYYQQELARVHSARNLAGSLPPSFEWVTEQHSVPNVNIAIPENCMQICIDSAQELEAVLSGNSSRSMSVSYEINISKDCTLTGSTRNSTYNDKDRAVRFDYRETLQFKRNRSLQSSITRKKAEFALTLHRGMFFGSVELGRATVPLADLLTGTECGGELELTQAQSKENGARPRERAVRIGGSMTVTLKIRSPIEASASSGGSSSSRQGLSTGVKRERVLVIGAWPEVVVAPPPLPLGPAADQIVERRQPDEASARMAPAETSTAAAKCLTLDSQLKEKNESASASASASSSVPAQSSVSKAAAPSAASDPALFKDLTEEEKIDPFDVKFFESNDAMEEEINFVRQRLAESSAAILDADERARQELRLQLLETKLMMLVRKVQDEEISIEEYILRLEGRLKRDRQLAVYFKSLGDTQTALALIKRIKVVEKEIKSAQGL